MHTETNLKEGPRGDEAALVAATLGLVSVGVALLATATRNDGA